MNTKRFVSLTAAACALVATLVAPGSAIAAPENVSSAAFPPLASGIADRPAILLETDYYVYGPGTGFDTPELTLTMDNRGYDDPVSMYLYWENRSTGQRQYYNVNQGLVGGETDLFSVGGGPVAVFAPSLTDFKFFGAGSAFGAMPAAVPSATGQYQWVFELRSAANGTAVARGNAMYNQVDGVVQVAGQISGGNWTANNAYFLAAPVNVTSGVLGIEPGTVILGSQQGQGTLVVLPGAQINADGTSDKPIIFTSELPVGQRGPGDWGGLVVNGNAPVNGGQREGEGDSGLYGGNNPADNSGVLRYVRVEFAGIRFNEQNELNGIALQGVGSATVLENLQVHANADDGIEFFGGTVNAKRVLITDSRDDSLDWTFGWVGKLQFFVAIQRNDENDHGIEADNDGDNNDLEPRSNPTIYNATFVGNRPIQGSSAENGWLLRRGTWATIRNFILMNFDDAAVEIDGTVSQAALGNQLTIENGLIFNTGGLGSPQVAVDYLNGVASVQGLNPRLPNPNSLIQPDIAPLPGSPARNGGGLVAQPPSDGFFDGVNYLGGVAPDSPWIYEGWTTFSDN